MDKKLCKQCKLIKEHIPDGSYPNGKDKRWLDEDKLLWNGKLCGKCNNDRLKELMRSKRTLVKICNYDDIND